MSKLSDIKATLKQLEKLGLPISEEQKQTLRMLESTYIQTDVIPALKATVNELFKDVEHKVKIIIEYDGDPRHQPNIYEESDSASATTSNIVSSDTEDNEKTPYIGIRVSFPDGRIIQGRPVEVLVALVKEVGPDLVHEMDIICCGLPLVDDHRSKGRYAGYQKLLPGGYWLITDSNTLRKKKQIEQISTNLDLGLKVEVLNTNVEPINVENNVSNYRPPRQNIKVTTPNGKVFYHHKVWETLRDVVLYAGTDKVRTLGQKYVGIPLLDDHVSTTKYRSQQHEIEPGVYLNAASDTYTKMRQIEEISKRLNLHLKVKLE
jgi:hypothetical protein